MKKSFTFLVQLLISLVCLSVTVAMVHGVPGIPVHFDRQQALLPALIGLGAGLLVFALFARFLTLYVLGHELMHWFAAKLFLRQTGSITVGKEGGSVAVDKPNIWITLAPYFVPIYTLLWIGLYALYCLARRPLPPEPTYTKVMYAGVGVTYAFHLVMTVVTLMKEQADLRSYGRMLSLSLILFFNVLVVFVGLLAVSRQWAEGVQLLINGFLFQWDMLSDLCWWVRSLRG